MSDQFVFSIVRHSHTFLSSKFSCEGRHQHSTAENNEQQPSCCLVFCLDGDFLSTNRKTQKERQKQTNTTTKHSWVCDYNVDASFVVAKCHAWHAHTAGLSRCRFLPITESEAKIKSSMVYITVPLL